MDTKQIEYPRFGLCTLVQIDRTSYTIPMAIVRMENGEEINNIILVYAYHLGSSW